MRWTVCLLLVAASLGVTHAQQSASHQIEQSALNAGGQPRGALTASSASFAITLDSLGDAISGDEATGSVLAQGGIPAAFRPPIEVLDLEFVNEQDLQWRSDASAGTYNLYRDLIAALTALSYGSCEQQALDRPGAIDADAPATGAGFFYLATAVNRISEEGSKGNASSGAERSGSVCP